MLNNEKEAGDENCETSAAAVPPQEKAPEILGPVSFPTSCDRKVQAQFDRAVAMLHSFWFQQGEKAFREVCRELRLSFFAEIVKRSSLAF
jgi:hypothetical protein